MRAGARFALPRRARWSELVTRPARGAHSLAKPTASVFSTRAARRRYHDVILELQDGEQRREPRGRTVARGGRLWFQVPGRDVRRAAAGGAVSVQACERRAYDVVIVGGGLAGLSLARQLLLASSRTILLLDRRALPAPHQKVGEATVQVSGYYFSKVLELEEHLLRRHYMKYNLRFHWPAPDAATYEACHQSYIRPLSNIATYQLDRNVFEAELLRVNCERPEFQLVAPAEDVNVELGQDGAQHRVAYRDPAGRAHEVEARFVVDATGRGRVLARQRELERRSPIRHGSTFCWVDGLVDIERLTGRTSAEVRTKPERAALGHLPPFLATNHFCGEGYWFWVIPLHGKTSLGLVYDRERVDHWSVATAERMLAWICERYPLFARDLPQRRVLEAGGYADFAHDCAQVLSADRWALVGEAGRFSDPLYSPGGDLIALTNTLVADAILTDDDEALRRKARLYESLARSFYEAYVPSYAVSYDTLGDQECFSLRYIWELSVYFAFYVFPFINGLFTDPTFATGWLRRFAALGAKNRALHRFLKGYYDWKRAEPSPAGASPVFLDFMESDHLRATEQTFYRMGLGSECSRRVLDEQLENLDELARAIVASLARVVTGDTRALSRAFVEALDFETLEFDAASLSERVAAIAPDAPAYVFRREPVCLARFHPWLRSGSPTPAPALAGQRR
jgi:flavin-dependent dehydrogenase